MPVKRFLVDITTSRHYIGRQPVGIVRVEREIAKQYFDHEPQSEFIYFDHKSRCFRLLSPEFVALVIGKTGKAQTGNEPDQDSLDPALFGDTLVYGLQVKFGPDDVIVSAGLAWDSDIMGYIYALKKVAGCKVVQVIHDIVPIVMPEYCVPGMELRFPKFILDVAYTADVIFCISENTRADLTRYLEAVGIATPVLARLHLGNTLSDIVDPTPPRLEDGSRLAGPFVVYVSTIEPRKNHQMLFNIWRDLQGSYGPALPSLVFVGRIGWNMDNLISYIKSSGTLYPHHIKLFHDVSDSELIWLYENARFTVYPSLYEGWGLPVVESLSMAKVCIAADCSSIPEAAAGCAELVGPLDYLGWRAAIQRCFNDDDFLSTREETIKAEFRPRNWQDSMQDFQSEVTRLVSQ